MGIRVLGYLQGQHLALFSGAWPVVLAAMLCTLPGCSSSSTANDAGGDGSVGDGGADGPDSDAATSQCPAAGGGPPMVMMARGYCIDSTEVSRGQYATWLASNPSPSIWASISPVCDFKTADGGSSPFAPDPACMANPAVCQSGCLNYPQPCVDWCQAWAFCKGAGKRLCGKIGGGSLDQADFADATKSQWYSACSNSGSSTYPYGSTYEPQACNGADNSFGGCGSGSCNAIRTGELTTCVSPVAGFQGAFDLSGNVWEWEDCCDGASGSSDFCRLRGGSYSSDSYHLSCDYDSYNVRNDTDPEVGFRCCAP